MNENTIDKTEDSTLEKKEDKTSNSFLEMFEDSFEIKKPDSLQSIEDIFKLWNNLGRTAEEDLSSKNIEREQKIFEKFKTDKWNDLSLKEKKRSILDLTNYLAADTGNKNPPKVIFNKKMDYYEYGVYINETNTIEINENLLDDPILVVDTAAHEIWHAHQYQESLDPTSEKGREYKDAFDNYIEPKYDFEAYENQMIEVEAREYAKSINDKLVGLEREA